MGGGKGQTAGRKTCKERPIRKLLGLWGERGAGDPQPDETEGEGGTPKVQKTTKKREKGKKKLR